MSTLFWVFVGALIGWNFPQPAFATYIQAKVVGFFKKEN